MIENMRRCMDLKALELPRIPRFYREFEEYAWEDKHLVQDIVIACALAVKVFYQPEQVWTGGEVFSYVEDD
jgi:hypothetical protein